MGNWNPLPAIPLCLFLQPNRTILIVPKHYATTKTFSDTPKLPTTSIVLFPLQAQSILDVMARCNSICDWAEL